MFEPIWEDGKMALLGPNSRYDHKSNWFILLNVRLAAFEVLGNKKQKNFMICAIPIENMVLRIQFWPFRKKTGEVETVFEISLRAFFYAILILHIRPLNDLYESDLFVNGSIRYVPTYVFLKKILDASPSKIIPDLQQLQFYCAEPNN